VVSQPCPGAAAGSAPVLGVNLLAADPLALAAGGTSLQASHTTGAYIGETAWNSPPHPPARPGSRPRAAASARSSVGPPTRTAFPASEPSAACPTWPPTRCGNTGMTLATTDGGQNYLLVGASGTSAAAPFWAAVIALADQYAGRHLGFVNPAIYRIGRSSFYHRAFHEVTTGTNTVVFPGQTFTGYQAGPGWNPVTGWGSPDAQVLVPLLARYDSS
jgi:subtilase family serine protease